jgi:hypothetical protein
VVGGIEMVETVVELVGLFENGKCLEPDLRCIRTDH